MSKEKSDDASSVVSGHSNAEDESGGDGTTQNFGSSNPRENKGELWKYQNYIDQYVFGLSAFLSKNNVRSFHYAYFVLIAEFLRKLFFFTLLPLPLPPLQ